VEDKNIILWLFLYFIIPRFTIFSRWWRSKIRSSR